jgi:tetratricopeptide (TPR) repeat protein
MNLHREQPLADIGRIFGSAGAVYSWRFAETFHREAKRLIDGPEALAAEEEKSAALPQAAELARAQRTEVDFQRLIDHAGTDPIPWLRRARWYVERGEMQKAMADFDKAVAVVPGDPRAWRARGELHWRLNQWDESLADYRREIQLDALSGELHPDDAIGALIRAQQLLAAGRTDEYRTACLEMIERFEKDMDPQQVYHAARACTLAPGATPDPQQIVAMAREAVSHFPALPWVIYTLGMAHLRAGQLAEATQRFQESVNADPDWPGHFFTSFGFALVHHQRGETQQAREWYAKGVELMKKHRPAAAQDQLECQLLRREVEQLLEKSKEEKHGTESKQEDPVAEPEPTDTKTTTSAPSAAEPKSIAKPKSPLTADPASAGA